MATFRDIWNLVVTGDTSDVERKVKGLGQTAETTGATVDTTFRGRMSASLGNFAEKIPGVSGLMEKFGVTSSQAGAVLGTAVAGGAAAAGAAVEKFLVSSVNQFQTQAQEVLHFKEVTGLAATEASKFVAVADDFGVSAQDLSTEIGRLNKVAEVSPGKLTELGIQIAKNKDGAYDAQQTFLNVVDAFNSTDDAAKRAAIGSAAFGKNWQSMVNLLDQGSGKIKESFASVDSFQLFNDADLAKSEAYRHAMDDLGDALRGVERSIGEALIPVLVEAAQKAVDFASSADKTLKPLGGIKGTAEKAAEGITGFVGSMLNGLNPIYQYHKAMSDVKDIYGTFSGEAEKAKRLQAEFYQVQDAATVSANAAAVASHEAELATRAHKREMDKIVDTGIMYGQTNAGITQALNDQRDAAAKATDALARYREEVQHLANEQLGLQGATYNTLDAIDAYTAKTVDGTASLRDLAESSISVQQSFRGLAEKAVQAAAAQAEMNGSTLTASGAIDAQVSALQVLFKSLASDSPLRKALDEYILSLYKIPGVITTNVDLTGTDWNIVKGREGNTSIGGQTNGYSTPAAVVGAIKTYESSNGTSWRTGPQ